MSDPRYSRSRVRGYHRSDGTYVRGHYRTKRSASAPSTDITDLLPFVVAFVGFLLFLGLIGANMPAT